MNPILAEFIGTAILVLFGNGVVANVLLTRTKGFDAGWIVITAGWGIAVYVGAFCSEPYSGAHLNPAVTVAMLAAGKIELLKGLAFMAAQFVGAMLGAVLVYLHYRKHFQETENPDLKLACFCTAPNIRCSMQSLFCETLGTFVLILPIFLISSPTFKPVVENAEPFQHTLGLGSLGLLPVALLVFGIGLSLGGTTGYAINPARDLAPRLVHALLPIKNKRDSDWGYAWVPVVGPVLGALLAALCFAFLM